MTVLRRLGLAVLVGGVLVCAGCGGGHERGYEAVVVTTGESGQTIPLHVGQEMRLAIPGGIGVTYASRMSPESGLDFRSTWSPMGGGDFVWTGTRAGTVNVGVSSSPVVPDPPSFPVAEFTVIVSD